ncbi:hypothetical protein PWG14_26205, partial [Chromobacterium amazonense]
MLNQLLDVKRRRERSLRAALARLADEELALCARQDAVHARRHTLYQEWRSLARQSGCFDHHGLERLRASLAKLEGEDQALARELETLAAERALLTQARAEQDSLLRRNLREQEKLVLLL